MTARPEPDRWRSLMTPATKPGRPRRGPKYAHPPGPRTERSAAKREQTRVGFENGVYPHNNARRRRMENLYPPDLTPDPKGTGKNPASLPRLRSHPTA